MRVYWGHDSTDARTNANLAAWVGQKLFGDKARGFGPCTTMAVFDEQELLGVMVFHNYESAAGIIEVSGAANDPRWLTRPVLRQMFAFPFDELGCQMVVMRVSETNARLMRILTAYGFQSYRIPRLRGRNEDEIVFTLTDDRWRNNGFHRRIVADGKVGS